MEGGVTKMPPVFSQPYQNPFLARRQQNILVGGRTQGRFGADAPPSPVDRTSVVSQGMAQNDDERYYNDINDLMTNVGPGIRAYRQHLTTMPDREQYRPSGWDRFAAALSGFSAGMRNPGEGIAVARDINEAPYRSAMEDYAARGAGLRERAEMEQDELNSKLRALQQARALGLRYDEYELRRRESEAKMRNDAANVDINRARADAYVKSVGRNRYNGTPQQDGSVLWVNENDPRDTHITKGNSVAAGQLGVARTNAGANVRRANTSAAAQQETGRHNREMEKRPTAADRPPLPRAQQDAEDLALTQMAADPIFSDYIRVKGGLPEVVEDDGSPDYQDFLDALDAKVEEILTKGQSRRRRQ